MIHHDVLELMPCLNQLLSQIDCLWNNPADLGLTKESCQQVDMSVFTQSLQHTADELICLQHLLVR